MDQTIKTPVTYKYPLAVKVFVPAVPFILPLFALIENGKETNPAHSLLSFIPFLIISACLAFYYLKVRITVTADTLIFKRAFSTQTVNTADITVLEITYLMRAGNSYRIVLKNGKKIRIPLLVSEQGDIIEFIKSIKGVKTIYC